MDILDDFEANALNDPLADLDRLLDLLSERYGVASEFGGTGDGAAHAAAADSIRLPASGAAKQ